MLLTHQKAGSVAYSSKNFIEIFRYSSISLEDSVSQLPTHNRVHHCGVEPCTSYNHVLGIILGYFIPYVTVTIFSAFFGLVLPINNLLLARDHLSFACL